MAEGRNKRQQQTPLKKKKQPNFKQTIASPYTIKWDALSEEDSDVILTRLNAENTLKRPRRGKSKKSQGEGGEEKETKLVIFGVNAVTRNLENGNLCLVICCKHVQPYLLVQHIPILCTLRNTPLLPLSNELSSFQLGKIFGLRTAVIIGFTNEAKEKFTGLIDFCVNKAPPINIPWVNSITSANPPLLPPKVEPRKKQKLTNEDQKTNK